MNAISPSPISSPRAEGPLRWALPAAFALALLPAGWAASVADERAPVAPPRFADARVQPVEAGLARLPPPLVEPLVLKPVAPRDAVEINAAVPFSTGPNPAARPFGLSGSEADRARAIDCLAAANLYEAGDDTDGQRAVAQVVINRLRHPAFPKTVCGVVFQGSERRTGCQFTFTCDGALNRRWSDAAWGRARETARAALTGRVDKRVGHSTHYHTDWVVPYWSSSLDKVAAVGTHLFFRWTGWWGTPGAFRFGHAGGEPGIAKMAGLSAAHAGALAPGEAGLQLAGGIVPIAPPTIPKSLLVSGDNFVARVSKRDDPEGLTALALATCGAREYCKFMAWTEKDETPNSFPIDPAKIDNMDYSYLRNRKAGFEKPLWNCKRFDRVNVRDCMKSRGALIPVAEAGDARLRVTLRDEDEREAERRKALAEVRAQIKDEPRRRPGS